MLSHSERAADAWKRPILKTVAQDGTGVAEVVAAIDAHRAYLEQTGELARRRTKRARVEVEEIALGELRRRWGAVSGTAELDQLAARVATGEIDPYGAADELLKDQ